MAHHRENLAAQRDRRQRCVRKDPGRGRQGASKPKAKWPFPRSARLNTGLNEDVEQLHPLPTNKTCKENRLNSPQFRTRKRSREGEGPLNDIANKPVRKRQRASPAGFASRKTTSIDPIEHWRQEQTWPEEYFEPEDPMSHLRAKRKSTPPLRRKRSQSALAASSNTPSDQKPREEKSAPYRDPHYEVLLETNGSFMRKYVGIDEKDVTSESTDLCRSLLEREQKVPGDSLFDDDIFDKTCDMIQNTNEAKVIQDISRLLVPSAQALAMRSAKLECLVESVNEGWNNSIPLIGPRPQPDYAVGFKRTAFSNDQLSKIKPILGDIMDMSFFMATYYMYFPFLTCEVKCGAAALDVADRQNAHSMTLAVRAIVELFRLARREKELHQNILAFSISHDHRIVRIYGHYPVIKETQTTFYRHPIREFSFIELEGNEKWTAYRFTKNVYDIWMPTHLDRIRSVIDELPSDFDFDVPLLPEESGLSQGLQSEHPSRSNAESVSQPGEGRSQSGIVDAGDITPDTSFTDKRASKRLRRTAGE
ncbi:hypothetical protein PRK78_001152 [Emydomyces testavorans]|uniref:DUF7924 domain-containing protein n=1 Tax=Emydomyces testavorans TaxID=2070801 RepID=A0AAF0DC27_9EURO|nr:hypothetical protein PRK78_001152 [Emydomyces testavorans]